MTPRHPRFTPPNLLSHSQLSQLSRVYGGWLLLLTSQVKYLGVAYEGSECLCRGFRGRRV